jgi:cystathionine beta-lyase/cystathionine gamma-synthase
MAVASARPLLAAACAEVADDLRELMWIAGDQVRRAGAGVDGSPLAELRRAALADAGTLLALAEGLVADGSRRALNRASHRRARLAQGVRERQSVLAGALAATSWQSPSIRHAHCPQAGPAEGRVTAHRDDYARDRHPAGAAYERALAATRIVGYGALLTSCGMSAVVVALAHLERLGALRGGVLLGASTYHETRDLLLGAVPHAMLLHEHPDTAFAAAVERLRPACVVLDAVATEHGAAIPDIPLIAQALARARPGAWLIVDITGCPLIQLDDCDLVRVLAIESLTKHAQLGLDRVTGGAIYARNSELPALDELREHLGANIVDTSVHALPTPQRDVLARRLGRHARNAAVLAHALAAAAPPGADVGHPALGGHPAHGRRPATWLTLGLRTSARAGAFVDTALAHAETDGVALVEGASFGLDTTRVYAPAPGEGSSHHFVRISPGIEHLDALRRLERVLVRALRDA